MAKKSGDLVVIKRSSLPDDGDLLLDWKWTPEAKKFLRANPWQNGESYEEKVGGLYTFALLCRDMQMDNESILAALLFVANKWDVPYDEDYADLIKLIVQVRTAPSGTELVAMVNPMEKQERPKIYSFRELLEAEFKVAWIVPGLLTESGVIAFCGPPGVGKTQLMIRFAMAMAIGEDFLGYKVEGGPRSILFISLEMIDAELQQFISAMAKTMTDEQKDLLNENFSFYAPGTALYLNVNDDRLEYWRIIKEREPDGIIIDSWSQAVFGDLSSDTVTRDAFAFINLIRRVSGCFVGIINHTKKAQGDSVPNNLDGIFGSRFFGAAVSGAVVVWPNGKSVDTIELHFVKNRFAKRPEKPLMIKRKPGLYFEIVGGAEQIRETLPDGSQRKAKSIFDMVGVGEMFTIPAPKKGEMAEYFDEKLLGDEGDNPMPGYQF